MVTAHLESPAGWIEIQANESGITGCRFCDKPELSLDGQGILHDAVNQLNDYFSGELEDFSVPLCPSGTRFQLMVWKELVKVPFGQVITYKDLAIRIGSPHYARMVGQANSLNPIWIFIPCHRVIGSNGSLTGYAGGIWRKQFLLDLERRRLNKGFKDSLF